jgi:predicted DNA-binding transcriptional regulator YafY
MSRRDTAEAQLERMLYTLPAAARDGGASLDTLARTLDVPVATVLDDIERVAAREYYHPAGTVQSFSIAVSGDRVHVHAPHEFKRPVRLNDRETLALSLGLRVLASEVEAQRAARIVALAERLERELATPDASSALAGTTAERAPRFDLEPAAAGLAAAQASVEHDRDAEAELFLDLGADEARGVLADAIERQRRCTITYVKPGDTWPAERRIEPCLLVHHDGFWYVIARDVERDAQRVFRVDRMLVVRMEELTFAAPADFDAAAFFQTGVGPFLSERDDEVVVRYSPRIARWIAERTAAPIAADGSVAVRHRVADTRWIVRHVLQYGGDAVVEDSTAYRQLVAAAAQRLAT